MTSGGARIRNNLPDENSARSQRLGYSLTALPSEGYLGPIPDFPFPDVSERELEVWEWAWRTPQACAWMQSPEQWRLRAVATWTLIAVRCEDRTVPPTVLAQLHRLDDKIGFSTAGLAEMGWKIAVDELAEKDAQRVEPVGSSRERMKLARGA